MSYGNNVKIEGLDITLNNPADLNIWTGLGKWLDMSG